MLMLKDVAPETGRAAEALGWRPRHPSFPDAAAEAYRGYRAASSGSE